MAEQELRNNLLGLRLDTTRVTRGNFDSVFLTEHDTSQIVACFKKANYVRLADDQSLPDLLGYVPTSEGMATQQDMLKERFRKVEL